MARKTIFKKRETINIYIDQELKKSLEAIAINEGETVSQIIRTLIKKYIVKYKELKN